MNIKSFLVFLSRNKGYTLINILGLSLSMMFVTLIGVYTWQEYHVNTQYANADRILVYGMDLGLNGKRQVFSGGNWRLQKYFKSRYPEIESSCAIFGGKNHCEPNYTNKNGQRQNIPTLFTDSTFFTILGIQLVCGDPRTALADPTCAVVSEQFARQHYGSVKRAIGQRLVCDWASYHITGVMPRIEHSSLPEADIVARYENLGNMNPSVTDEHLSNATGAEVLLMERKGAHLENKLADMDKFQRQFFWIFQMPGSKTKTMLTPLSKFYFTKLDATQCLRQGDGRLVGVLLAVGIVILLFAVFNYVNLTNALSGRRMREMAMRRLVGASRSDVVRRVVGESVLLCVVSMAIALALAWAATPYTERLLNTELDFSMLLSPTGVGLIVVFTLLLGVVAGAMPATIISRAKPIDIVKGTTPVGNARSSVFNLQVSKVLIIIQNTATIVLIAVAFAMSAQINHLIGAYRGFKTHNIIDVPLSFGDGAEGDTRKMVDAWYDELKRLPQVVRVSACIGTPYSGGNNETFKLNDNKTISSQVIYGDSQFLKIFGLKPINQTGLRNKRGFQVYVNRQMLAEEGLPLDSRFFYWKEGGEKENISGVLDDFIIRELDSEQHPVRITIAPDSLRYSQWETAIEVQGDPVEAWQSVQRVFKQVFHADLDYYDTPFIDQRIEKDYEDETRVATILRLFALIAVVISVLGLVAISTYYINDRRREIALRKVFGSTSAEVSRRFIGRFLSFVAIAFVIATPIIIYFYGSWVAHYSHRALWWPWIVVAGLLVLAVSFAAVYFQVRHASRQNPADNLKAE